MSAAYEYYSDVLGNNYKRVTETVLHMHNILSDSAPDFLSVCYITSGGASGMTIDI